jgi:arylsulfatase
MKDEDDVDDRPNIIIILADDLGYSDVGCYGSEIRTPNIDSLAYDRCGIRFSQMYNCARCCPSRASLLTGMYPHQAGIGHMAYDAGVGEEYRGYLRRDVMTIAELLKGGARSEGGGAVAMMEEENGGDDGGTKTKNGGYATFMVGKWHVGGEYPPDASHDWIQETMSDDIAHPTPISRGFDDFYGTLGGGGCYYRPPSLVRNGTVVRDYMPDGYYYTDAINDEACAMIEGVSRKNEAGDDRRPFFMYVAHTAPHWYVEKCVLCSGTANQ